MAGWLRNVHFEHDHCRTFWDSSSSARPNLKAEAEAAEVTEAPEADFCAARGFIEGGGGAGPFCLVVVAFVVVEAVAAVAVVVGGGVFSSSPLFIGTWSDFSEMEKEKMRTAQQKKLSALNGREFSKKRFATNYLIKP